MSSLLFKYFIASAVILNISKDKRHPYVNDTFSYFKNDSVPSWVRQLYEKNDTSEFANETREVLFFKFITDTTSYALYTISTGTCLRTYVATQKNRQHYSALNISEECDEDLSEPEYSWATYKHDSVSKTISITYHTEKANSKYLTTSSNTKIFKKGYDMDNVKRTDYLTKQTVMIEKSGNLKIKDKNSR